MKWNSIRTKLIVFMLLATTIPIVATMVVTYYYTAHSLKARVAAEDVNLLYQGGRNLINLLDDINRTSSNIYNISNLVQGGYEDVQSNSRVYAVLSNISTSVPDIFQIYLYEHSSRKATIVSQNTPQRNFNVDPYADVIGEGQKSVWIQPSHMSHTYGLVSLSWRYPPEPVFTVHRKIEKVPSTSIIGYLSIDVKLSALSDIVDQLYEQSREKIYILDDNGYIIYSDEQSKIGNKLEEPWYTRQIAGASEPSGNFETEGSVFVYHQISGVGADWTLVKQVPVAYLTQTAIKTAGINLLLLAVSLILIILATIIISLRITAPIKRLSSHMNEVQQTGNLNVDVLPAGKDEIGLLTKRFRTMLDTINNFILKEYKLELSSKNNQLRALQAQINPHFLNNTLQIIGTLALELKVPQIYTLISALAKMMHYSMHNSDRFVTLKDELDHVKAYMELQKERFEGRFSFTADIPQELLALRMPKLILQPIMENYFKHGIDRSQKDGLVGLRAFLGEEGYVTIIAYNNGAPIPPEKLALLQSKLKEAAEYPDKETSIDPQTRKTDPPSSIGLVNVLTRLRLVYGEEASLAISPPEAGGVQIILRIPAVEAAPYDRDGE
ncbi:cache domain-containing sensor histidine kinase [Paenibacillus sanguinis]|uniref:cache domain-containing sensor histidine kinase n=1 Tax=Paenibacillus sanguinis TaxID=225906 RepID=UPI000369A0F5|nr:sensor histidine kinase [Paenibacillus sanguinis]